VYNDTTFDESQLDFVEIAPAFELPNGELLVIKGGQ
jgi:hypothetical protein